MEIHKTDIGERIASGIIYEVPTPGLCPITDQHTNSPRDLPQSPTNILTTITYSLTSLYITPLAPPNPDTSPTMRNLYHRIRALNRNVITEVATTACDSVVTSMTLSTVLGPYLYALCGDHRHTGYVQGLQGLATLLTAVPAGLQGDKGRRDTVIRWAGAVGLVSNAVLVCGVVRGQYAWVAVGLGLLGVYEGGVVGPANALYADSVPAGSRSVYEAARDVVCACVEPVGPLLNMLIFAMMGNEWDMETMTVIFIVGMSLSSLNMLLLGLFNDDHTVGGSPECVLDYMHLQPLSKKPHPDSTDPLPLSSDDNDTLPTTLSPSIVPYLVALSDFVFCIGTGMTVAFLPVYFSTVLCMTPALVSLQYALQPLGVAVCTCVAQWVSRHIGRVQTITLFRCIGIAALLALVYLPSFWIRYVSVRNTH